MWEFSYLGNPIWGKFPPFTVFLNVQENDCLDQGHHLIIFDHPRDGNNDSAQAFVYLYVNYHLIIRMI